MKVEEFEKEVIRILCSDVITNSVLSDAINHPEKIECKFTGAGYYLDIHHHELPSERIVLDTANIEGMYQDIEVGFVVFVEDHVLCLECYNYGNNKGVPPGIRNGTVTISQT